MKNFSYFTYLLFWIFFKIVLVLAIILYFPLGLGPDEAQYWTWSQMLDWGYYSKPPGIAWQIKIGTTLFGNTELGVRVLSLFIASIQSYLVYVLALKCQLQQKTAFWSAIIMTFSPLGLLGSILAITDGGMLLFWTAACIVLVAGIRAQEGPNCLLIGLCIALGALFKWPIYFFWIFYSTYRSIYFPFQPLSKLFKGLFLSLIGLLPSLWWNLFNNAATFRHVLATLQGGSVHKSSGNFFEFIGTQLLLLSPILFGLLVMSLYGCWKKRKTLSPELIICWSMTLTLLVFGSFFSFFQKVQGNWVDFLYPIAIVVLAWYSLEIRDHLKILKWGVALSLFLVIALISITFFYTQSSPPWIVSLLPKNLLKQNLGWQNLSLGLKEKGYNPAKHFLISDKYQTTSLLSFYTEGQKRAYFLNLQGMRKNQFSYWPTLDEDQNNQEGFFVSIESIPHLANELTVKKTLYLQQLSEFFKEVEFIGIVPLVYLGPTLTKAGFIYKCTSSKCNKVTETEFY